MKWKWAPLTLEVGIVCAIIYLLAQTFCDVNFTDIAQEPAVSRKACSFPLPKIQLPDWPGYKAVQDRAIQFFSR